MTDFGERRRSQRVDSRLKMELYLESETGERRTAELESVNISTSGVYFLTDHYIPPMTKLALGLQVGAAKKVGQSAAEPSLVKCHGLVVRVHPEEPQPDATYEVAVFFTWIDPDCRGMLIEHIDEMMPIE